MEKLTIRWSMAVLAMAAGAGGACSPDNVAENDAETQGVINQLQNELDTASAQGAISASYRQVKPVLKCVEKISSSTYKAHWGYTNSSSSNISIPIGFNNRFWPSPINQGQPTTFLPGTKPDVVQVTFNAYSASVWILGASLDFATKYSKACPTGTGTGGSGTGGAATGGAGGKGGSGGSATGGMGGKGGATGTGGSATGGAGGKGGAGGSATGGSGTGGSATGGSGTGGSATGGAGGSMGGAGGEAPKCPSTCDDSNPCTTDICNASTSFQCSHVAVANGSTCNDGNACTVGDSCQAGVCAAGTPRTCAASDQCHAAGVCDAATGACSNPIKVDGSSCNDSNACTTGDQCLSGICTAGNPKICAAADQCHAAGVCDATTGACSNPSAPNGTVCNDNNLCTTADICTAGVCGGTAKTCAASDQCHAAGICDQATGSCSNPPVTDGTACNDSNLCTNGDMCVAGVCTPGTPKVCAATDQCHAAGTCNSATGACSNPPVADGTMCNDNNGCTVPDVCTAGVCGGTAKTCTAADQCHIAGMCDATTGSCSSPNAPDGTACTTPSGPGACSAGACVQSCSDPTHCRGDACNVCQVDNCSPSTDGCDTLTDPAAKKLCQDLYACFTNPANNCLLPGNQGDAIPCWCGTNPTTCVSANSGPTKANGPCLDLVTQGAGLTAATYDAATIKARLINPAFPLGRAINLTSCEGQFCNAECMIP